jgi:hypothetical protein
MGQTNCKQYAFSVDFEERVAFNQAVKANGVSAIEEMRRMVDDFLRDQSLYSEIMKTSRKTTAQVFPTKMVKLNAHFDGISLRRFTVICQYANVCVSNVLREMIVAYAQKYAGAPEQMKTTGDAGTEYLKPALYKICNKNVTARKITQP